MVAIRFPKVLRRSLLSLFSLLVVLVVHFERQPVFAQRLNITSVAEQVYQQLPDLPRENQFISIETGQPASSNTLVSRLIRYHTTVRGRLVNSRLDWKLTLADFLGANERVVPDVYPGADTLRPNPVQTDTAIIRGLNRQQREQLIAALLNAFGTLAPVAAPAPSSLPARPVAPNPEPVRPDPDPSPLPGMGTTIPLPNEPRPGDAQFLLP